MLNFGQRKPSGAQVVIVLLVVFVGSVRRQHAVADQNHVVYLDPTLFAQRFLFSKLKERYAPAG